MKTDELREKYLDFFKSKNHTVCPSDVMVPKWDKSVLFTPAGMNQFKDHFLGNVELEFTRATTSQKCLRTGDIENVGRTAYHHTFFEMLGNFSFGDYFKRDAIHWAWEFLTDKKWLDLEKDRLSVTVFLDDDEASDIWHKEVGLSLDQIKRLDEAENFWPASSPSQGPDGVCGPCSEIFFHPDDGPECEIWNLVFTQFNREGDPPNNLNPLPSKNIDTGMGLERTAATLQGATTNFHIDTLMPIVQAAAEVCGVKYEADSDNGRRLRRITDHVRACSLAIHENVYPGAQKEESVVRQLLRRAVLQGYEMGLRDPFLYQLVPCVVEQLGKPYPELRETVDRVSSVIKGEENGFYSLVEKGIPKIQKIADEAKKSGSKQLDAESVAIAYQTHGVPAEIAESVAEENGLKFDWDAFAVAMDKHGITSGTGETTVMGNDGPLDEIKQEFKLTKFVGYEQTESKAKICGLIEEHAEVTKDKEGKDKQTVVQTRCEILSPSEENQIVVLLESPFYAESGGQVGDTGVIEGPNGKFEVADTKKDGEIFVHYGHVTQGTIGVGEEVTATVNSNRRDAIRRAHSATHILHHALQQNVGEDAQQRGSKVSDDALRFDFASMDPIDDEVLATIERQTNERIAESVPIKAEILPLEKARETGAMMLFGEKYPDPVRMVSIGEFSKELCGGIHLDNSSSIETFEIVSEENMSAGTRRIQALTGQKAKENQQKVQLAADQISRQLDVGLLDVYQSVLNLSQYVKDLKKELSSGKPAVAKPKLQSASDPSNPLSYFEVRNVMRKTAQSLNIPVLEVADRVTAMLADVESTKLEIQKLSAASDVDVDELIESAELVGDIRVIARELPGANSGLMSRLIDEIRKKTQPVAILFATSPSADKVTLASGLSRDLVERGLHAGKWIGEVAVVVGGRGGGKPDLAQAGGKNPEKIAEALKVAVEAIK
ncbi:MAG: alanine--tRNA ligase [Mariniblastus sp.]